MSEKAFPRPRFEINEPVAHDEYGVGDIRVIHSQGDPGTDEEVTRVRVRFLADEGDLRTVNADDVFAFDPFAPVNGGSE